ncbi:hypothetical protein HNP33_002335 [Comamonas odontotermitis]|uniref:Uncharacterized protein n=1 Tax=Comamonas odontotermitis TaxID=379895 RepID=A0ABR6RGH9_9BURK|nr:hypothetical protein [Comamonas odontotermitis]MBB6578254.1 hypothetical protein [Comamonas odontotermitis]
MAVKKKKERTKEKGQAAARLCSNAVRQKPQPSTCSRACQGSMACTLGINHYQMHYTKTNI